MLHLESGWRRVLFMHRNQFLGSCGVLDAARTAVIGHMVGVDDGVSLHNRPVDVGGVNDSLIHMHHRGVVGKGVAAPFTAGKADAPIAEAVVHAAVVAHVAAPVALMEHIAATGPAPPVGGPESALIGSRHPCAGNPVVIPIVIGIGPVAGNPHQVGFRADGLHINRQFRRRKPHTDDDLCVRRHRNGREKQRQQ